MDDSDIPYTERELIQRALTCACDRRAFLFVLGKSCPEPRWVIAKSLFGVGSTVAKAICYRYGLDAERMIGDTTNG